MYRAVIVVYLAVIARRMHATRFSGDIEREAYMDESSNWVTASLLLGLLIGIGACLWRLTAGPSTPNEALMLSLVLTIFSILGSWIASRHYAEVSFNRNLRLFALKAAEKVTNLSDELNRLSAFLQEELKSTEYESAAESLLAKNSRIEGAIHIINTLKSVNDRSLSDWQGVIGEEITAQREIEEEREESLRDLLDRLESLSAPAPEDALRLEMDSIRNDLRFLAAQITGAPISAKRFRRRIDVVKQCPQCGRPISYRQRLRPGGTKSVDCTKCGAKLFSKEANGDFLLQLRQPVTEQVKCPRCATDVTVRLDPVTGSSLEIGCSSCTSILRVTRSANGIRVKIKGGTQSISAARVIPEENIIRRVEELMGPQPWPKGRARTVADQMGVSRMMVQEAVRELIRRGIFKVQIDGVLYASETPASSE
jgi:hypothetical protein